MGKCMSVPIIVFCDHPGANTGLARIARDLCTHIHNEMYDEFRICSLGYGSPGSIKLPFPQYQWKERDDFLPIELMTHVVKNFCGDDPFILMTIGDIQRFLPLADPQFAQDKKFADWLTQMRKSGMMKLWGYFPIDAHCRGGGLGPQLGHTLSHYDRRIVPGEWAREIVKKTLPNHECSAIPHGIDTSIFRPHPDTRPEFGLRLNEFIVWPQNEIDVPPDALWVGIIATNQQRKDWALGIEVVAELAKTRPVFLWAHTDRIKAEWSILELLSDFGLLSSTALTLGPVPDAVMAESYCAMDLTLGIGQRRVSGYPIFESLACGTPCVTGDYGGHAEFLDGGLKVDPLQMRIEGPLNLLRPIFIPLDWVHKIQEFTSFGGTEIHPALDWKNLWPSWREWFLKGIQK